MEGFPPDWNEFIRLLKSHRVRFVIVVAHAVAAAGRPRATQDLDVFVERLQPWSWRSRRAGNRRSSGG
jgi:hypothetical protein